MQQDPSAVLKLLRIAWSMSNQSNASPAEFSRCWVKNLAGVLRLPYSLETEHQVFDRACPNNRGEFGFNELPYDILVARFRIITSARRGVGLTAIEHAEWIIESELSAYNSRDVLQHLNKLVIGAARNKLLVVTRSDQLRDWMESLVAELMANDPARIFFAEIPSPGKPATVEQVALSMLVAGRLVPVESC